MSNPIQHRYDFVYLFDVTDGNARADQLFGRVNVELRDGAKAEKRPPRPSEDYSVTIATDALPSGVTLEEWV